MRIPHGLRAALAGSAGGAGDPDFKNTVLLLHGDGTNGAQNNTFIDGSTNNFTITRNGNTTQGTFSPFGDRWSNYFSSSGDNLRATSITALGSGDFTLECFIFPTSFANFRIIWDSRINDPDTAGFAFGLDANGKAYFYTNNLFSIITSTALVVNQWTHLAVVRSGSGSGNLKIYINGVADSSTATTTANFSRTNTYIGNYFTGTGSAFVGFLSNLRTVTSAVYTSNFTPPTAPLTAITNTSLLTCHANRFIDGSSNAFTITRNGDVSVQKFNPFGRSAAYSASTDGGSGYFDGTGDWINAADNAALAFSGDFTVEAWLYLDSASTGFKPALLTESATIVAFELNNGASYFEFAGQVPTPTVGRTDFTATVVPGSWNHIAFVRSSGTVRVYVNGTVSVTTLSNSATTGRIRQIGNAITSGLPWKGYISSFRSTASAVYTSNFTPPTSPLTAITNTSLLLNFTNGGIIDNTGLNVLETVGNAQLDTGTKKFGTGALEFDGNGDYCLIPASQNFAFGTGDFTVEYWINTTSSAEDGILQISTTAGGFSTSYTNGLMMSIVSGVLYYALGGSSSSTSATINDGNWHHVAMSRAGSSLKVFVDGSSVASVTNSNSVTGANLVVGGYYNTSYTLLGFIDDLRISRVARYTANFTPPAAPFADF